jgi:hypothetical protein
MNRRDIAIYNFWILVKEFGERNRFSFLSIIGKRKAFRAKR